TRESIEVDHEREFDRFQFEPALVCRARGVPLGRHPVGSRMQRVRHGRDVGRALRQSRRQMAPPRCRSSASADPRQRDATGYRPFACRRRDRGRQAILAGVKKLPPGSLQPALALNSRGRMMIDLYYCGTPNGLKMTMFLEEAELPYRIIPVGLGKGEQF